MKVLKSAEQKNIIIDTEMYTVPELLELFKYGCWYLYNNEICQNEDDYQWIYQTNKLELRISTSALNEIKVVYDKEFGFYATVATLKNHENKMIYIRL